jgi:hypothetical protein
LASVPLDPEEHTLYQINWAVVGQHSPDNPTGINQGLAK